MQDRLDRIKSLLSKITFLTKVRVCYKYCIYRKNDAFVAKIGNRKVGNMHLTKFFVGIYNCNSAIKVISIDSGPQSQVIRPGGGGGGDAPDICHKYHIRWTTEFAKREIFQMDLLCTQYCHD